MPTCWISLGCRGPEEAARIASSSIRYGGNSRRGGGRAGAAGRYGNGASSSRLVRGGLTVILV